MSFHQDDWVDWLPLAEFAANNVVSETTGVSPFFTNYGYNPKIGIEPSSPCPPDFTSIRRREFYRANAIAARFSKIFEQLRALATLSQERYEENENSHRKSSPRYQVGDMVYVDTRNMKTNRPMKKGDDKWDGPYKVLGVYPRACKLELPREFRIYPVFHNNLIKLKSNSKGLKGQDKINELESRATRGRILEREDGIEEPVEKYEFVDLLDNYIHPKLGAQYLIKWKYQKPSWQPAADLKGQDEAILRYHQAHKDKPGPPAWVKRRRGRPKKLNNRDEPALKGIDCNVSFAPIVHFVAVE